MSGHELVLPELYAKPHIAPVPRRYEETRPALVQEFSHRRIINLGTELHRQLTQEFHKEKVEAIQTRENGVWSEADAVKQEALQSQKTKLQAEHDKHIKKIKAIHERTHKEELIHLSAQLDRLRLDDIAQTKRDGEHKLQEAVHQTELLWQETLLQTVEGTRLEERQKAADIAAEVAQQHQRHLEALEKNMIIAREYALKQQKVKLDKEKVIAMAIARKETQAEADKTMAHMNELFEKQVAILHSKINSLRGDVAAQKKQNEAVRQHRVQVQQELQETRHEFQTFIDVVYPFNNSESKYIIPPIKSFRNQDSEENEV